MARTKQTARSSHPKIVLARVNDNGNLEDKASTDNEEPVAQPSSKKNRLETSPSATPSLTVQQSELYAHLIDTKYHDVIIIASNGTRIPTHRSILSYYSPRFTEIFRTSKELPVQIYMNDVDTIKAALDYMLFKPDSIVGKELALFKFGAKYNFPKLMENNVSKLEITKSNVVEYVQIAYQYNLEGLKEKCLKVLAENKKEIDVDLWNGLPKNVLVDLIGVLHY
uniref:BTB domain-containing protein n=1 Tax=Panagrolaimus davidi TaxID=227884 RepID=A0A914QNS2_9BILA